MRISDWSSDVCSSDLASSCNGRFSAWGKRNDIVFPPSVRPELVEGLFFFRGVERQGRPFDKLRTNGFGYWSFCMTRGPWHVAVLMGGWSAERAVSLMSGRGIAAALDSRGHRAPRITLAPNRKGRDRGR